MVLLVQMFPFRGTQGLRSESVRLRKRGPHAGQVGSPHHPLPSRQRLPYFEPPWCWSSVDRRAQGVHRGSLHHALLLHSHCRRTCAIPGQIESN